MHPNLGESNHLQRIHDGQLADVKKPTAFYPWSAWNT